MKKETSREYNMLFHLLISFMICFGLGEAACLQNLDEFFTLDSKTGLGCIYADPYDRYDTYDQALGHCQ